MSSNDLDHYKHLVKKLLYLSSEVEIQNAVRLLPELEPNKLRAAFDEIEKSWLEAGRNEERELCAYVRELLSPYLSTDLVEPNASIIDAEGLVRSALQQPTALRMRTLLRQHCALLTGQVVRELRLEAVNPNHSGARAETRHKLFCAVAIVINDPALRVQSNLIWASLLRKSGRLKQSERPLRRGIRLAERIGDPKLMNQVLAAQIGLYYALRDLDKVLAASEQMLQSAVTAGDQGTAISLHMGIAQCCYDLGLYPKALDHLNSRISILADRGEQLFRTLELRGRVQENLGRYDQGLLDYQRAHELAQEMGDRQKQFLAMNYMAESFLKRGLKQEGYRRFTDILRTATRWGNPVMIASTHNNLGNVLLEVGRFAEASEEFKQALQFYINSDYHRGQAIAALGLGDVESQLGHKEAAKAFYTIGLMRGLETGDVGIISMYASRAVDKENPTSSQNIELFEWALKMAQADRDKFLELSLTNKLCDLHVKRGEREKAIELYRKVMQQSPHYSHAAPEFLDTIIGYSRLLMIEPEGRREAYELLTTALAEIQANLQEVTYDERRAEIIAEAIKLYQALLSLLIDQEDTSFLPTDISAHVFAFDLHESAKSRSFISDLSDSPIDPPPGVPPELISREADLLRLERGYQNAEAIKSEVYRAERLKELRKDMQECWREMEPWAMHYVRFRSGEPFTYRELSPILFERYGEKVAFISFFCDESTTTVFVMRRGLKEPMVYRSALGRGEVERAARLLRRSFNGATEEFPPYPPIIRDRPFRRPLDFLEQLSERLLPFLPEVEEAELLCLAPHGPLHLIPLQALLMPDGNYLAHRFGVVYTPSLSSVVQLLTITGGPRQGTPSVLVAGVSAAEDKHPEFFEHDAEIFAPLRVEITSKVGIQNATRYEVLDALPAYDIVHLSCHGYFEEKNALNSGLLLSDGRSKSPKNPWSIPVTERNRFLITVRDLMRVRLRANLVTLNACSTGWQGQRNAGDELEGFSRALLLSGASSVLLTLWNVDQESSRHFLASFYRNWIGGDHPIEKWRALQFAQRELVASDDEYLRHPYHWAPFTLSGDWR